MGGKARMLPQEKYGIYATRDEWEEIYKDLEKRWNAKSTETMLNLIRTRIL